jgi:predicted secreted acid phosphatase
MYRRVDNIKDVMSWSMSYLSATYQLSRKPRKPCIVLDIDGTILSNIGRDKIACSLHMKKLVNECTKNGIVIYAVTARTESTQSRRKTNAQLLECGVNVRELFMRPEKADYASYKWQCRKLIRSAGFDILLSIGDQWADLTLQPPAKLSNSDFYVGQLVDDGDFGVKLPSEFGSR